MWKKLILWMKSIFPDTSDFDKNKLVFSTSELYLANIIKLKLEGEGIYAFIINKKDSAYNNFGQIELYVKQEDVIKAKYIIDETYD